MSQVAVIGAGLIGRAWAIVFARAGWEVALHDAVPETLAAALDLVSAGLDELGSWGLIADPDAATRRVRLVGDLAQAIAGAHLVQENVPETLSGLL